MSTIFNTLGWIFAWVGWAFYDLGGAFHYLYLTPARDACYDIMDWLGEVSVWFFDLADAAESWWNTITYLWSDMNTIFSYAYGWLTDEVNWALANVGAAYNKAVEALGKATDAFNYAYGWLTDRANEAWQRAGNTWGTVTDWLRDQAVAAYNKAVWAYEAIAPAVLAKAAEIYNWVKGVPAEIRAWTTARIDEMKTWAQQTIDDGIALFAATIAAPINLVSLWFQDIQDFFNDPAGWITNKLDQAVDRLGQPLWNIIEKILEKVW